MTSDDDSLALCLLEGGVPAEERRSSTDGPRISEAFCFFGPFAKEAYALFFEAASGALSEKLATAKGLKATVNGFTVLLHTWNQQLGFHPHLHCLVPGAGLNERGRLVRVRKPDFLVHLPLVQAAFRQHLRTLFQRHDWEVDPEVWRKEWGCISNRPATVGRR